METGLFIRYMAIYTHAKNISRRHVVKALGYIEQHCINDLSRG